MEEYVGYGVCAAGLLIAVGQAAWSRIFGDGAAHAALVEQLTQRIASQEQRLLNLESGLDEERRLRRHAEDKVQALEFYVVRLKAELQKHGIEVPKPDFDEYKVGGSD